MLLTLIVGLIVLVVFALVGVAGYLIDESEERLEHDSGDRDRRA